MQGLGPGKIDLDPAYDSHLQFDPRLVRSVAFVVLIVGSCLAAIMWPALIGTKTLAFRDSAHFYRPLYEYLRQQSSQHLFPRWNPNDSFGVPLAGEAATALYYPGRLILLLASDTDQGLAWYVYVHLILAACGTYLLCRAVGAANYPSVMASLSYTMSGGIFFLYSNPPFLIGAAWLPFVFLGFQHIEVQRSCPRALATAATALAMCVLGGDPQTAFHAVLIVMGIEVSKIVLRIGKPKVRLTLQILRTVQPTEIKQHLYVVFLAICLAFPQIVAGVDWSAQSHRSATNPHSIFQSLIRQCVTQHSDRTADESSLLLNDGIAGQSHSKQIYHFSIAPWHLTELLTPFISGPLFPVNGRFVKAIPSEPRMWTPTIYLGLLPIVFMLAGMTFRGLWNKWLAVAAFSTFMALGEFGGYSVLVTLIPEYSQFRYPAKWLPFLSLGMAIYASTVATTSTNILRRRAFIVSSIIAITSAMFLCFVFTSKQLGLGLGNLNLKLPHDLFWGPVNLRVAEQHLIRTFTHTTLLATVFLLVFRRGSRTIPATNRQVIELSWFALLVVTAIDLTSVAAWQRNMFTAEAVDFQPQMQVPAGVSRQLQRFAIRQSDNVWPTSWTTSSSKERANDVDLVQQQLWFSRWHLPEQVTVVNNSVSQVSYRASSFWAALNVYQRSLPVDQRDEFLVATGQFLRIDAWARRERGKLELQLLDRTNSSVEWHTDWEQIENVTIDLVPSRMLGLMQRIREHSSIPWVESGKAITLPASTTKNDTEVPTIEPIQILNQTAEQLDLLVQAPSPGLISWAQYQDGNWRAYIKSSSPELYLDSSHHSQVWTATPDYRVDLVGQGVFVPSGCWHVRFVYSPRWFGASWLVCISAVMLIAWLLSPRMIWLQSFGFRSNSRVSQDAHSNLAVKA